MILVWLVAILLAGGFLAWILGRFSDAWARWTALAAVTIDFVLATALWIRHPVAPFPGEGERWLIEIAWDWIPRFGIRFHLALDGLSLLLVVLTLFLGVLSVATSWSEVRRRVGFFHFNLLWVLAGIVGVFLAMDLFLFYFFWELMLVPMYLLIGIWGYQNRIYAAIKFFIFTQASGLLMLLAILAMGWLHLGETGTLSFAYADLLGLDLPVDLAMLLMLGFFIAFVVKLPAVPFHTWLPDAHTEAPTAGSVVLAGLLLKTGGYGLIRFAVPLFPEASAAFAPVAMALGVLGIVYGALVAFAQTDLKRLVAYTSVAHLGFVLLGIYAWNALALQGVVMQMIAHGLSTGGLFILVGQLYERVHTRDLARLGGLWSVVPRMGAAGMILAMASLGLPGLGNFVAEFLVLAGAFRVSIPLTAVAMLGVVFAVVYSLRIAQRTFQGPEEQGWKVADLNAREIAIMASMVVVLVWLGLYPQPVLDAAAPALEWLGIAEPLVVAAGPGGTG